MRVTSCCHPLGRKVFGLPPLVSAAEREAMLRHSSAANYSPFDVDTTGRPSMQERLAADALAQLDAITRAIAPKEIADNHAATLSRADGQALLYSGEINWIHGKPGGGKTWIGLCAVPDVVINGGRVALLDTEDKAWKTHQRAEAMDSAPYFTDTKNVRFLDHELWEWPLLIESLIEWLLGATTPSNSFVIIDSARSSGAANDGASITAWLEKCVLPFYRRDIGVLVVDHTTKNRPQDDDARGAHW